MAFCENSFGYWTLVPYWHEKLITIMWDRYKKKKKAKKKWLWFGRLMGTSKLWYKLERKWLCYAGRNKVFSKVSNLEIGIDTKNIWIFAERCPGKGVKLRASCHQLHVYYRSCSSEREAFRKEPVLKENVHRQERIQGILGLLSWKIRLLYLGSLEGPYGSLLW